MLNSTHPADLHREGALHASLSYSLVLSKAFPSLLSLLQPAFLKNFFNLHVIDSLYGRCAKYFSTERMRRAFSFGSMCVRTYDMRWVGGADSCIGTWAARHSIRPGRIRRSSFYIYTSALLTATASSSGPRRAKVS